MRLKRSLVACAAIAVLLSGCAALPGFGPAPLDTFDLTAPAAGAKGRHLSRTQVLIAEPTALKTLDSQNIVIRRSAGSIEYLAGAQWADRLPEIIQARLAETFQHTGRLGGVGKPGEGLAIDYQVVTDIRVFEIRIGSPTVAAIELFVRVLNDRNGVVRASRTFTALVPVQGSGNAAFIAALDAAFGQVASEITDWSISVM